MTITIDCYAAQTKFLIVEWVHCFGAHRASIGWHGKYKSSNWLTAKDIFLIPTLWILPDKRSPWNDLSVPISSSSFRQSCFDCWIGILSERHFANVQISLSYINFIVFACIVKTSIKIRASFEGRIFSAQLHWQDVFRTRKNQRHLV